MTSSTGHRSLAHGLRSVDLTSVANLSQGLKALKLLGVKFIAFFFFQAMQTCLLSLAVAPCLSAPFILWRTLDAELHVNLRIW
jgi:hypothetical protein